MVLMQNGYFMFQLNIISKTIDTFSEFLNIHYLLKPNDNVSIIVLVYFIQIYIRKIFF